MAGKKSMFNVRWSDSNNWVNITGKIREFDLSGKWQSCINICMLLLCTELPLRPAAQPTSLPRQSSHDGPVPVTSPRGSCSSPSSPTAGRPPLSPSCSDSVPSGFRVVAVYDFDGDTSLGDLVFRAGETIVDVRNVSAEWMSGRIGDRMGSFPTAFVQISWSWINEIRAFVVLLLKHNVHCSIWDCLICDYSNNTMKCRSVIIVIIRAQWVNSNDLINLYWICTLIFV